MLCTVFKVKVSGRSFSKQYRCMPDLIKTFLHCSAHHTLVYNTHELHRVHLAEVELKAKRWGAGVCMVLCWFTSLPAQCVFPLAGAAQHQGRQESS